VIIRVYIYYTRVCILYACMYIYNTLLYACKRVNIYYTRVYILYCTAY